MGARSTMQVLRRKAAPSGRRGRRGATFIEWAILMPIFMFIILFVVDVGHMILVNGVMQDATYSAARAGAQVGGGGFVESTGGFTCTSGGSTACKKGITYNRWSEGVKNVPGGLASGNVYLVSGAKCTTTGANAYVTVKSTFAAKVITPGLGAMLRMMGSKDVPPSADANAWTMSVVATSRCEVTR